MAHTEYNGWLVFFSPFFCPVVFYYYYDGCFLWFFMFFLPPVERSVGTGGFFFFFTFSPDKETYGKTMDEQSDRQEPIFDRI